ncbi:hypothetical protein EIP91_009018 [Steccherinum ochraceum]|uniref:DUF6534 domain-containing protein n=1 Tax=Steccherinum ochraceum TaxID=92696 RepID=A0A4R0R271_9APHY|nr:hypothetical protein EIP91_009018 [Steccherinum ochraceum]
MGAFDDTTGALLVGPLVTTFLYGFSTLQTYIYFTRHTSDKVEMKLWVAFIWIVDTTQAILVCYGIYFWVQGLPKPEGNGFSDKGKRTMEASSGMNVSVDSTYSRSCKPSSIRHIIAQLLIAFSVQCFFVKQTFQLSRDKQRYWLLGGLGALVATHLGSEAIVTDDLPTNSQSKKPLVKLILPSVMPYTIAAVLSDLCIAVTLILLLRRRRSDVMETMNSVIDKVVNYVLTRCLLVTIAAIVRLITFAALPNANWFIAIDFMMGKIYSNSFLAMLNSRQSTSRRVSEDTPLESRQYFTTVLDVPEVGPESTITSVQTTVPQRTIDQRSSPVDIPRSGRDGDQPEDDNELYKNSRDTHSFYIPPYSSQ